MISLEWLNCQNDEKNYKTCEVLCLRNSHFNGNHEQSLENGADPIFSYH